MWQFCASGWGYYVTLSDPAAPRFGVRNMRIDEETTLSMRVSWQTVDFRNVRHYRLSYISEGDRAEETVRQKSEDVFMRIVFIASGRGVFGCLILLSEDIRIWYWWYFLFFKCFSLFQLRSPVKETMWMVFTFGFVSSKQTNVLQFVVQSYFFWNEVPWWSSWRGLCLVHSYFTSDFVFSVCSTHTVQYFCHTILHSSEDPLKGAYTVIYCHSNILNIWISRDEVDHAAEVSGLPSKCVVPAFIVHLNWQQTTFYFNFSLFSTV